MGQTVFHSGIAIQEGAHVFCHSRKDGKEGLAYLVINNSATQPTAVELPKEAEVYVLAGRDGMRSTIMTLNGRDLVLGEGDELPCLAPAQQPAGTMQLAAGSCAFILL